MWISLFKSITLTNGYIDQFIGKVVDLKAENKEFTIAPKYSNCRFNNYYTDKNYPSQDKVLRVLTNTCKRLNSYLNSNFIKKHFLRRRSDIRGLYLDGKFGIGKTHLLAAIYQEFQGTKAYLSFSDLMHYISFKGLESVVIEFKKRNLICIDEFELDDPGNTMKAGNFIRLLLKHDVFFVTTSNTVPGELGKNRFSAKSFENEIGSIAAIFKNIKIDGKDYRLKSDKINYEKPKSVIRESIGIDFNLLNNTLRDKAQVEYEEYIKSLENWHLERVVQFKDQDLALRFSYFVDKIYDLNYNLTAEYITKEPLFPQEFINGPYEKKYKRCLSRLHEMTNNYLNNR